MKQKIKTITYSPNQEVIKVYIERYFSHAKGAVENLIEMSKTIYEISQKVEKIELTQLDEMLFCCEVGITYGGPHHRKHICIGQHASMLEKYKNQIPSAISTVYQLTVKPEESEELILKDKIKPSTTLRELKILMHIFPKSKKKIALNNNYFHIKFSDKKIDDSTKQKLVQIYRQLQTVTNLKIDFPHLSDFSANDANVIDIKVTENEI